MRAAKTVMWGSLGLLVWTHVGYPLAAVSLARFRRYRARHDEEFMPEVALVITAHNEEAVIGERLALESASLEEPGLPGAPIASDVDRSPLPAGGAGEDAQGVGATRAQAQRVRYLLIAEIFQEQDNEGFLRFV